MDSASITTSAIISFSEELENRASTFYGAMAERWPDRKETFQTFARDGVKNRTHIVRTYQETISDALEASFSFEGINLSDYGADTSLPEDVSFAEALDRAITLEERACAFYRDVAERSESLLATIPRAFQRVAKKREKRKSTLEALASAAEGSAPSRG